MMMVKWLCILVLIAISGVSASSQALVLDERFRLNFDFHSFVQEPRGVIPEENGSLLVYGYLYDRGHQPDIVNVFRFNTDGTVDRSFRLRPIPDALQGTVFQMEPTDYGYFLHQDTGFKKSDPNGNDIDPDFKRNLANDLPIALFLRALSSYHYPDGRIISGCSGGICRYPDQNPERYFFLYRLLADGHYDPGFTHTPNGQVLGVKRYSDEQLLVFGFFSEYDGVARKNLVRIDTAGNLDTTFRSIFLQGDVYPAHVQEDGKIIVTGFFRLEGFDATDTVGIVRLMPDGSLDSTFNNRALVNQMNMGVAGPVCPMDDGGYLIGGYFQEYDGYARGRLVKTDANGFVDECCLNGAGLDSVINRVGIPTYVTHITRTTDNYYYVTGEFRYFDGQPVQPVIRLKWMSSSNKEVKEAGRQPDFVLFPNPAESSCRVELSDGWPEKLGELPVLRITDIYGRICRSVEISDRSVQVDLSGLSPGIYLVHLFSIDGSSMAKKLLVQPGQ